MCATTGSPGARSVLRAISSVPDFQSAVAAQVDVDQLVSRRNVGDCTHRTGNAGVPTSQDCGLIGHAWQILTCLNRQYHYKPAPWPVTIATCQLRPIPEQI
jgi:hypothetical protein